MTATTAEQSRARWGIAVPQYDDFLAASPWDGQPNTIPSSSDVLVPNFWGLPRRQLQPSFDAMFEKPNVRFWACVDDGEVLVQEVPQRLSFGWTALERQPFTPGDFVHIDDLYYRNQCGYAYGDWQCGCPLNDDECSAKSCPLGSCADSREQLERIGVVSDYDRWFDDGHGEYTDESEWVEICRRPREGMIGNLHVGFRAANKLQWQRNARLFRRLRHDNPYIVTFAIVLDSFEQSMPYYPLGSYEPGDTISSWHPSETYEFGHAGERVAVPYLNAIWTARS